MAQLKTGEHISRCIELALLLEASAHKPGNISIVTNFEKTRYEHFLASAVAARPSLEYAATQGIAAFERKIDIANAKVGTIIRNCVAAIDSWQHGGNTLLGAVILLVPLAVATGMTPFKDGFVASLLRKNLKVIVESTTPDDAVKVYEAIAIAKPSGLGKAAELDVNDPNSTRRIIEQNTTLYQVFKIAEEYDTICSEWVNNYPVTFDIAYPSLIKRLDDKTDLNEAIVHTFLEVLAKVPDTFITRKAGLEKSKEVSMYARRVLDLGGLTSKSGIRSLHSFDQMLRRSKNLLNPGTTADIIATALALCVLGGYRP